MKKNRLAERITAVLTLLLFLAEAAFGAVAEGGLTYGMITKAITKGATTQAEVIQMFGAPNITTVSKEGQEVWTYDNIAAFETTEDGTDYKMVLLGGAAGAGLGAIVGHQYKKGAGTGIGALVGGAAGALAGWLFGYKNPTYRSGSKNVTLMVWFDKNIVRDYSVISSKF